MNKREFLVRLREGLSGLPREDAEERVTFYSEMIDDRVEEGISEEAAVSEIGNIDELISQITAEISPNKPEKEKLTPKKKPETRKIVLLALGSPIWIALMIAAIAVIFSLVAALWAVIISLWAVFGTLAACILLGAATGVGLVAGGRLLAGIAVTGAGIACAGLAILMFLACRIATKSALLLTKRIVLRSKSVFAKGEKAL